jgi:tight adherence protein C
VTPLIIAVGGAFVLVAMLAGSAASWWLAHNAPEQRRLRSLAPAGGGETQAPQYARLAGDELDPVLERLSRLAARSPKDMSRLQRRMARAGYPTKAAAVYFALAQLLLPVLFFLIAFGVLGPSGWMWALLAAGGAYVLPGFFISHQTAKRQKAIQNGLADGLDLLTVCIEAGSGLDQAIARSSDELDIAHPELAGEFRAITTEIRAGVSRLDAFKNFATRTGVDDVRALVSMLAQTDRFGTSIGQALRGHAETIRTKRRQRAEERAAKVSVKMVFPLALCLFPALYVICFGSVVIRIIRAFY